MNSKSTVTALLLSCEMALQVPDLDACCRGEDAAAL